MDSQTSEALQGRVAWLERRILFAAVGFFFVTGSLVVGALVQNVHAQPNVVSAAGDEVTRADLDAIRSQVTEFRGELAAYGIRLTAVEEELHARKPAPEGQVTAQSSDGYWTIITLKMQVVEGRGVMQVMGPFPSAALCDATLKGILAGIKEQGIAVESSRCRTNVTIAIAK